jgi:hypothetical protein
MKITHHTKLGKIGRDQWLEDHDVVIDPADLTTGPQGPQGAPGKDGKDGLDSIIPGPQGVPGRAGTDGKDGADGARGPKGDKGNDGYTPVKDVDYFDGAPGATGPASTVPGPKGDKGDTGNTGAASTVPGPQGPAGAKGDKGDAGTTDYTQLQNVPSTFTPSAHAHAPADITGTAVITTDSRLSDARTPTAHTHPYQPLGLTVLSNDTLAQALATNTNTKLTVTANRTLTTTVPAAGVRCSVLILTSGGSSFTITFGSGFKPTGTLATGTTTGRIFVVNFISDGTNLYEAGRTAAMVACWMNSNLMIPTLTAGCLSPRQPARTQEYISPSISRRAISRRAISPERLR